MLSFSSLLVSSGDAAKLADFYRKVLGAEPVMEDSGYVGFQVGATFLTIGPHDGVSGSNPNPERILINFETGDVRGEFERIRALGARVVAEPYSMDEAQTGWIATFADPDGNYFQLMSPFEM